MQVEDLRTTPHLLQTVGANCDGGWKQKPLAPRCTERGKVCKTGRVWKPGSRKTAVAKRCVVESGQLQDWPSHSSSSGLTEVASEFAGGVAKLTFCQLQDWPSHSTESSQSSDRDSDVLSAEDTAVQEQPLVPQETVCEQDQHSDTVVYGKELLLLMRQCMVDAGVVQESATGKGMLRCETRLEDMPPKPQSRALSRADSFERAQRNATPPKPQSTCSTCSIFEPLTDDAAFSDMLRDWVAPKPQSSGSTCSTFGTFSPFSDDDSFSDMLSTWVAPKSQSTDSTCAALGPFFDDPEFSDVLSTWSAPTPHTDDVTSVGALAPLPFGDISEVPEGRSLRLQHTLSAHGAAFETGVASGHEVPEFRPLKLEAALCADAAEFVPNINPYTTDPSFMASVTEVELAMQLLYLQTTAPGFLPQGMSAKAASELAYPFYGQTHGFYGFEETLPFETLSTLAN